MRLLREERCSRRPSHDPLGFRERLPEEACQSDGADRLGLAQQVGNRREVARAAEP